MCRLQSFRQGSSTPSASPADAQARHFYQQQQQEQQRQQYLHQQQSSSAFNLSPLYNSISQPSSSPSSAIPPWAAAFNSTEVLQQQHRQPLRHQAQQSNTPQWASDFNRFESAANVASPEQTQLTLHTKTNSGKGAAISRNDVARSQLPQANLIGPARLHNASGLNVGGSFANAMTMRSQQHHQHQQNSLSHDQNSEGMHRQRNSSNQQNVGHSAQGKVYIRLQRSFSPHLANNLLIPAGSLES